MTQNYLGERVRSVRESRGWTPTQLANALAISCTYVTAVESGKILPGTGMVKRLADALKTDVDHLEALRQGLVEMRARERAWRVFSEASYEGEYFLWIQLNDGWLWEVHKSLGALLKQGRAGTRSEARSSARAAAQALASVKEAEAPHCPVGGDQPS